MSATVLVSCSTAEKAQPYVEALHLVGVREEDVRLVPADRTEPAEGRRLVAEAGGLVLCGGPDLDPRHYGEEPHPHANLTIMPERDALEQQLIDGAREAGTPVFGVCRGLQMLNAHLGGTLWQDLKLMWPGSLLHDLSFPRDALIHRLDILAPETPLGEILGREASLVNSRHHQAIKDLAPALEAVAAAPDGIVEAARGTDPDWWVWGVQWHPENLVSLEMHRSLWREFAEQVAARAAARREAMAR
jgi:putative glutamine amidotransferase